MNLKELDSFKLSDAISFHNELNPNLWDGQELKPEVKEQLLYIAKDFLEELGVDDLDVVDITVSGSNAAYSYTPHSDLDLHILVDLSKLDNDEIYKELFNAKKTLYNDTHDITIHGVPVELYVQDAREPVISLGEYSILHDEWLRVPTKRRANLDQTATKAKYEKLLGIINKTLKSKNILQVNKIIHKVKQYRQAGLDKGGEFGPENLAYKILRKQGLIDKLYQLRDKLHSEHLTIENMHQKTGQVLEDANPKYVTRLDSQPITDFISNLRQYRHTSDWQHSGLDTSDDSYYTKRNLKTKTSKGLFAGEPQRTALYSTGNAGETRYVEYTLNGQPIVYFDKRDINKVRKNTSYLSVFDSRNFRKLPTGEYFSENPGKPLKQQIITNPYEYMTNQGWMVRFTDDLDGEFKKAMMLKKKGKIPYVGAEGMDNASIAETVSSDFFNRPEDEPYIPPTKNVRIGDFEFNARSFTGGLGNQNAQGLQIRAYDPKRPKGNNLIGSADFIMKTDKKGNTWLESDDTEVNDDYRGQGVATMMYAFAKSLGNDIKASPYQSNMGKAMWGKWGSDAKNLAKEDSILDEVFNTPTSNVVWDTSDKELISARFTSSNGTPYVLSITAPYMGPDEMDPYDFFDSDTAERMWDRARFVEFEIPSKTQYQKGKQGIEGTGAAAEVFGIVSNCLLQYVQKYKPSMLYFQAAEPNRARLYKAICQRMLKSMPNWGYKLDNDGHHIALFNKRLVNKKQQSVAEASGYIPSEKEKNDPRFKTALTVDIKPDTMKKNAEKFGNKISRAGIPPTIRTDGKF